MGTEDKLIVTASDANAEKYDFTLNYINPERTAAELSTYVKQLYSYHVLQGTLYNTTWRRDTDITNEE